MTQMSQLKTKQYNITFCILSALAIIMVAAGHIGYPILTVGELFPYYSFHVPLFMFISGYFYRESEEEQPLLYVKKKVLRLLVPYMVWNLIYGLMAWALRAAGFIMGEEVCLRTLFVEPFMHGHQFMYNFAAWFVPALFIVEMLNLCARLVLRCMMRLVRQHRQSVCEESEQQADAVRKKYEIITEWIMLVGSLIVGMAVVWLAIGGHVWDNYRMPGRILFLFPGFQMGQFYKKVLERHDTLGNLPYFGIVIGIQVILNVCCKGLAFSSVWCSSFANGPVIPYMTIVSGIAFWLRVAKVVTPVAGENRAVRYLGRNTYAVMMHHVMAFMLVKMVIAAVASHTAYCPDFDFEKFHIDIGYFYLAGGAEGFAMVYLLAGIVLPLGLQYGLDRIKGSLTSRLGKCYNNCR